MHGNNPILGLTIDIGAAVERLTSRDVGIDESVLVRISAAAEIGILIILKLFCVEESKEQCCVFAKVVCRPMLPSLPRRVVETTDRLQGAHSSGAVRAN